ncbi:MAG: hypothetical protein R3C19_07735 [Planctomycetaceae bacterium]
MMVTQTHFQPGDLVIYHKTKHSTTPGPRASDVQPARNGDTYSYTVDKFWIVRDVLSDGTVIAETRRGKRHHIKPGDPLLKRASFLQRLMYRSRFSALAARVENEQVAASQN